MAVGKRWAYYDLADRSPAHTVSGVVFMVRYNQVQSLDLFNMECGRTVSQDLAEGMCSSNVLRKVVISDSYFHEKFYEILREEALNCQIEYLWLQFSSRDIDFLIQSMMGGNLAQWVCAMPHLSTFILSCHYLPDSFILTAADSPSSCQIREITIYSPTEEEEFVSKSAAAKVVSESVAENLAEFLCRLPHLARAYLTELNLPEIFFRTIASQSSRCKVECIIVDGKPLSELLTDYQGGAETPSDGSGSEGESSSTDESSHQTGQNSGQENLQAPHKS
ncbi:uncharacterized protein [Diadema setosum]|uniref:uncharacterized protein n=1 Tax=Diadema setosum TaxID=31175 RepID=UPI003B3A5BDB